MTVRPARLDDVAGIAALEQESLGADAWPHPILADGVAGVVPTVSYLVAENEERLVGYAVASLTGDVAELQRIAVTPTYRRNGVATALVDAVEQLGRATDAERLLLEVREDNAGARALYAACGFTEISRRPRYYRDGTTALVLARELASRPAQ